MLSYASPKSEFSARQNLKWLFILRNLMILSEVILIVLSIYGLNIRLPEQPLWLVVLSIVAVNIYTSMRLQTDEPVTELEIFSQLVIDVFAITALLYLTGGASNPITWVFLLPLIITAIMLHQSYAWYMVILTSSMYTALIGFNIPLPSVEPHMPESTLLDSRAANYELLQHIHVMRDTHYFNLHIFGMWFGFVFSAGLVAFFVVELAKTLKAQERNLAEARENALRDERVVALGTLAASAAHDMGTPLGTIAILTHEIGQDYPDHRFADLHEKLAIMQQEVNRCKTALSVMSASAGEMRAESGRAMLLTDYLDDIISQWRTHKPTAKLNLCINPDIAMQAKIIAELTLTHSIINILNNAAEATLPEKGIELHATWDLKQAIIRISDYGPGLPPELIDFAGKQPVVSKKRGLGVGLFLTYSTINRLGGKINFYNSESGGANVEISLPLLHVENNNDDAGNR
ncbi:MAG: ATP-binding protein [Methylobacter sp.]|nr:ATP-binding protein [Methylobacter sp.]MDP2428699.1 ATP-binding protein [Methylobacter sp.]MDP3053285.1 ATP-binding protein [Methylobacter sp.]MDP3361516.1 ATP-binding protein [Methylobacter sp.]MDZ4219436.1 ATP-binding protein [Methylobacter sp.]